MGFYVRLRIVTGCRGEVWTKLWGSVMEKKHAHIFFLFRCYFAATVQVLCRA